MIADHARLKSPESGDQSLERTRERRFRLRGDDGIVAVDYGVNDDRAIWAFDLLILPFDLALAHGFLLMPTSIDDPGPRD